MSVERIGDLELDQDLAIQEREYRIERIAWMVMILVLACAALGLFSGGPLSRSSVAGEGIHLQYERFARYQTPMQIQMQTETKDPQQRELGLTFDASYLRQVQVVQVVPPPTRTESSADHTTFVFPLSPGSSSASIVLHLKPQKMGSIPARIRVNDGSWLVFDQFVYP